jgi:hypothetical protein
MQSNFEQKINREIKILKRIKKPDLNVEILSNNSKTIKSINFPSLTCWPSNICRRVCYATKGPIIFDNSIYKYVNLLKIFLDKRNKNIIINKIKDEAKNLPFIRWNGCGDLTKNCIDIINKIDKCQVIFSRKPQFLNLINDNNILIFSVDESSLDRLKFLEKTKKIKIAFLVQNFTAIKNLMKGLINKIDLIFLTDPIFISKIPKEYWNKLCPCDASFTEHNEACVRCWNKKGGCFK